MTGNLMVTLRTYTEGVPGPDNFAVVTGDVPVPRAGEALCRTLYVSLDPYLRLSLLPPDTRVPTGGARLSPGQVVAGRGVAEVVESGIEGLRPGELVTSETGWQAYSLVRAGDYRRVEGISPPSAALGVLGMPGCTAWVGLRYIGPPQPGQTVVVSAASGAVGSVAIQLAKRQGCRTVGIAGSDEKCRWVRDVLGADECISHRSHSLEQDVATACPQGVDVYFDNVGGDVLAALLTSMNRHGTVVVCGRIAHLNEGADPRGVDRMPALLGTILTRALTVRGFSWSEYADQWDDFVSELGPLVRSGEIKFREDIVEGLEQIPSAFSRLFDGRNFGKLLAHVSAEQASRLDEGS